MQLSADIGAQTNDVCVGGDWAWGSQAEKRHMKYFKAFFLPPPKRKNQG